jgi:hypothetical protein
LLKQAALSSDLNKLKHEKYFTYYYLEGPVLSHVPFCIPTSWTIWGLSPDRTKGILVPKFSRLALWPTGYWGTLSQGVNRPGRDSDHSPAPSAVVKNEWSCTFTKCLLGIFGQLCPFGRGGEMKELAAGLNPVLRNRTVHSTLLSAEIQETMVQRISCLQQRGLGLTHT